MLKIRHSNGTAGHPEQWALAGAACAWLLAVVTSPLLPVRAGVLVYALGSVICHQLPARSFHLGGAQFAVCARCTGIYAGAAVTLVWCAWRGPVRAHTRARSDIWRRRVTLAVGCAPTVATVGLELALGWPLSNLTRAIAGAMLGSALALVVSEAATLHYGQWPLRPRA